MPPAAKFAQSFLPAGRTVRLDVTDVANDPRDTRIPAPGTSLRVFNDSTVAVCICWGPPDLLADWGLDVVMAPGSVEVFGVRSAEDIGISACAPELRTGRLWLSRGFGQ